VNIQYSSRDVVKLLRWLIGLDAAFVVAYFLAHIAPGVPWQTIRALFDLSGEVSLPTWFSTVQLFALGAILLLTSRMSRQTKDMLSPFFAVGGFVFIFLSADEGAGIHERITGVMRTLEVDWLMFQGDHGAWIPIYLVVAIAMLLVTHRYIRAAWKRFRRESFIALCGGLIFTAGAVGAEIVSYLFLRSGSTPVLYKLEVAIEEFLEMSGISIILYSALVLALSFTSESYTPRTDS
jgi:hypothetical protein